MKKDEPDEKGNSLKINGLDIPESAYELVATILGKEMLDSQADLILKRHQLNSLIEALTHWGLHAGYDLVHNKDKQKDVKHGE